MAFLPPPPPPHEFTNRSAPGVGLVGNCVSATLSQRKGYRSFWLETRGDQNHSSLDFDCLVLQWNCAIARADCVIPWSCCFGVLFCFEKACTLLKEKKHYSVVFEQFKSK